MFSNPSLPFLADSIAHYLLEQLDVKRLPVPVREILEAPPQALTHDLSLSGGLALGDARWIRLLDGQGVVFVNGQPALEEPSRRFAMASATFYGICSSKGGRLAGFPSGGDAHALARYFARALLMPEHLLPQGWESMPDEELASYCDVPMDVIQERRNDLLI